MSVIKPQIPLPTACIPTSTAQALSFWLTIYLRFGALLLLTAVSGKTALDVHGMIMTTLEPAALAEETGTKEKAKGITKRLESPWTSRAMWQLLSDKRERGFLYRLEY